MGAKKALILSLLGSLSACAGTTQNVQSDLNSKYLGQNVDLFVTKFGPPANSFKMHSGDTSYVWQLANVTDITVDKYGGSARNFSCKINVMADAKGTIKSLSTEDASNFAGESLCAMRLGIQRS